MIPCGLSLSLVGVYRDGALVEVGKVSTRGRGTLAAGQVVECKFLYVLDADNPVMFQPRIVERPNRPGTYVRDDKPSADCTIDQFADAATSKE